MAWVASTSTKWAAAATEVIPQNETAIRLASFDAKAYESRGVDIRWRTGGESGTLGFRIFRESADGEFTLINREMVAGSALTSRATLEAGYSYGWHDADGSAGDRYWLVEIEVSGGHRRHGPFIARASTDPEGMNEPSPTLRRVADQEFAVESILLPSIMAAAKTAPEGDLERQFRIAADGSALKIGVRERGWYRISRQDLVDVGFELGADAANLQLWTSGREVPIRVVRTGRGHSGVFDAIEFYGVGVDESHTDTRVYWLVTGDEAGRRIAADTSGKVGTEIETVPSALELRERLVYVASFANGDESNFYGAVLAGDSVERTLNAASVDLGSTEPALLGLDLKGFSEGPHEVRVEFNDVYVATLTGAGQEQMHEVVSVPAGAMQEGGNVLRLIPGLGDDISLVDVIRLQYPRLSIAEDDELLTSIPDDMGSLVIDGFSRPEARVFEVSDPFNVIDLTIDQVARDGGRRVAGPKNRVATFRARFSLPEGAGRTIHAIGPDRVLNPAWIQINTPSSWNSAGNSADVLVVAARELTPALQPLVDYRVAQGFSMMVASIEDVYDEYAFGIKRASAIRDLANEAVNGWQQAPKYLILVGDASYDPRNFLGLGGVDLVPTKFVATDAFEAASDDWFAEVNGDQTADVMVGRFPVKSAAELESLVTKIIAYEQAGTSWSEAMYVSDDEMGEPFETSNLHLEGLRPSLLSDRVVVRELGNSAAQDAVLDGLNRGVNLVSYVGHGSVQTWSGSVLSVDLVDQIAPDATPAVFTMMNCMNGYFFDAALDSLAEALLAADAGAIAVFAPTGISGWAPQEPMMAALYEAMEANAGSMTLGEAVAVAKQAAGSKDVRQTWVILGDPMITVR